MGHYSTRGILQRERQSSVTALGISRRDEQYSTSAGKGGTLCDSGTPKPAKRAVERPVWNMCRE